MEYESRERSRQSQEEHRLWQEGGGSALTGTAEPGTPEAERAVDVRAERYYQSGTYPPGLTRAAARGEREQLERRAAQLHPDDPPQDWPARWQSFKSHQIGLQRFTSGPQGNTIRSLGVVVDHLGTLQEAANALENKDFIGFNQLKNTIAEWSGVGAPTGFDATKAIVGTEVIKALGVAGAGTEAERQYSLRLSRANSPAQVLEVINDVRKLLGGQLRGLRKQWGPATGKSPDEFNKMLDPSTLEWLEPKRKGEETAAPSEGWGKAQRID
jgi:hypothetical protein